MTRVTTLRMAQKRMTRQLLMATALELFAAKGYAATTIDDIAAGAGTNRTTFYAHFPSRTDLMRALLRELDEKLGQVQDSVTPELTVVVQSGDPQALRAWIKAKASQWQDIRPYIMVADEASALDREIQIIVDQWSESSIGNIKDGLDRADRFDPGTRQIRAVLAYSQLDGLGGRWMRRGWDGMDADGSLEMLADSWQHLLFE